MSVDLLIKSGAGNRFYLHELAPGSSISSPGLLARELCQSGNYAPADGLILFSLLEAGLLRMQLWNADGSKAELSGNGLRCCAKAALERGLLGADASVIRSDAGDHQVKFEAHSIALSMGQAIIGEAISLPGGESGTLASIGNPHLVILRDDLSGLDAKSEGEALQSLREGGINVEWISLRDRENIDLVVYERGVGITQACGSGSCVSAALARSRGLVEPAVFVHNPGGTLLVSFAGEGAQAEIFLGGPVLDEAAISIDWPKA
ncbi:MAG: diaminopimelate epimerase [Actinomycetes bacterium]